MWCVWCGTCGHSDKRYLFHPVLMRQENLPQLNSYPHVPMQVVTVPWVCGQAGDRAKLWADGGFTLNSAVLSACSAAHALVYNEGDFAGCLPSPQAAGGVSARESLVQLQLPCCFSLVSVCTESFCCAGPHGDSNSNSSAKGLSRRGMSDLSCLVCSQNTHKGFSHWTCLLSVSVNILRFDLCNW